MSIIGFGLTLAACKSINHTMKYDVRKYLALTYICRPFRERALSCDSFIFIHLYDTAWKLENPVIMAHTKVVCITFFFYTNNKFSPRYTLELYTFSLTLSSLCCCCGEWKALVIATQLFSFSSPFHFFFVCLFHSPSDSFIEQ